MLEDFHKRLKLDESLVEKTGFNPYYCHLQSGLSDPVRIEQRDFINLASNNYLGLADDPRVKKAVVGAVQKYGASLCGTPIATGCTDLFQSLEKKLAVFVGLEDAILLPSGYQANNGIFSAIAGKEDVIVIDHFAHSSLLQGARAVGCKIRPFLHNNPEHLHGILKNLKDNPKGARQVFVVTESVFSTEGSIAPFSDIIDLCRKYQAVPVIDDSHGIGVLGKNGRGILEHAGLGGYFGLYTASLGKALANAGGMIAGNPTVINHLRYYCPHLVYSTALTPGVLAGVEAVLDIMAAEFPAISRKMWEYKTRISKGLHAAGFSVVTGEAPINSIETGSSEKTFLLAKLFYENQILATPFVFPSVPMNDGRLRLIAGANLTETTMGRVVNCFPNIFERFSAL